MNGIVFDYFCSDVCIFGICSKNVCKISIIIAENELVGFGAQGYARALNFKAGRQGYRSWIGGNRGMEEPRE